MSYLAPNPYSSGAWANEFIAGMITQSGIPKNKYDGTDTPDNLFAMEGVVRALETLVKEDITMLITEFSNVYREFYINFKDNPNDLGISDLFAVWYTIISLKPNTILEISPTIGGTTWLIHRAAPNAKIICIGKIRPAFRYDNAKYYVDENFDLEKIPEFTTKDKTLVIVSEKHNQPLRLRQLYNAGKKHVLFMNNYAGGSGDFLTLNAIIQGYKRHIGDEDRDVCVQDLMTKLKRYYIFPNIIGNSAQTAEKTHTTGSLFRELHDLVDVLYGGLDGVPEHIRDYVGFFYLQSPRYRWPTLVEFKSENDKQ